MNNRDNVKNEMEMFAENSTSLFAHLCRARQETAGIDQELGAFLQNKCGWTNATSASSPAVFFALLGVRNLITAHTLAKRCSGAPNKYNTELEKVKDTFPLAAQVEIDYALECLCRHYYFAQDKSAVEDDVVPRAEFERMQRNLRNEVEAARAAVNIEEEDDTSQVDKGGYKAVAGEKVCDVPTRNDMTMVFLQGKQLVVKYKDNGPGNIYRWYRGIVNGKNRNIYNVTYNMTFDDGDTLDVALTEKNYGIRKKWVMVENSVV